MKKTKKPDLDTRLEGFLSALLKIIVISAVLIEVIDRLRKRKKNKKEEAEAVDEDRYIDVSDELNI